MVSFHSSEAIEIARRVSLAVAAGLSASGAWIARGGAVYDLDGKSAIVTGGARGLGLEISRVLVDKGAQVAVIARDTAEIEHALADLRRRARGALVVGVPCDLRDGSAIDGMLDAVRAELGPIDVLVNNAGDIRVGPLDTMTIDDFESAMRLHCFAPLRTMLGVRADMRERGGGRIANISSIGGIVAVPHLLPYSTSKFALLGLSQGMRAELARDGILVSTIAPGLMRTGSPKHASFTGDRAKERRWFEASDSLPGLSMSSTRAARRIVRAIERGEAHAVLGLPARAAALANGFAPGLVARAMTFANSLLPIPSGGSFGLPSAARVPWFLHALSERAAARNNEQ